MITSTYYACLRHKDGTIEKKKCTTREEARQYISSMITNPETADLYDQFWTE